MGRGASCFPIGGSGLGKYLAPVIPNAGFRGAIPVAGSRSLARPAAVSNRVPLKFSPKFSVLGFTPENGVVRDIYLEETIGFEVPYAKITLFNGDARMSSTILAKEQSTFNVTLGFDNPGVVDHGKFIVQRPTFKFTGKESVVEVIGYGEAIKLGNTERREVYQKMSDSDIAGIIAGRNGFGIDSDTTTPVLDQVLQANESDWRFLARRAKLYGYMLYVENSILHFHRPRPEESGITLTQMDLSANLGNMKDFTVRSRTFMRSLKITMTQIDPVTKEEIQVDSTEVPDEVQTVLDYKNWKDLATIQDIGQSVRFITGEGHQQKRTLLQNQVSRMAQASRYVIAGHGLSIGLESLRPNQFITIEGVGRSSGKYYVTGVIHQMNADGRGLGAGYNVRFDVVRAGAGANTGLKTPVEPQSAGTVSVP